MNSLFDKFSSNLKLHAQIVEQTGVDPLGVPIDSVESPTRVTIHGRSFIQLGSNNYLGLTFLDEAIEKACEALETYGTGTTGSRAANGNYLGHRELEQTIAGFLNRSHAMLFTTGYQANVGFLSTIVGKDDILLIDADSHASIYDGCKLGDATALRFRHNDPNDLGKRLSRLSEDSNKLVVLEGIYSMLGDRARLKELVSVAKEFGAYVMVDEAHSLGVLGANGRGLAEEAGVEDQVDFVVGTFSKSVGAIGGFCVSNHEEIHALRLASRPYLFTASLPPSVVTSCRVTIETMARQPALRKRLWENAHQFYEGLRKLGFEVGPEESPIVGVRMQNITATLQAWRLLYDQGIYANLALPPATPGNVSLLRCSVCAGHTREELNQVLDAFALVQEQIGAVTPATKTV